MPDSINLFAWVDDEQVPVRRIPLSGQFGAELAAFFALQQRDFVENKQPLAFSGSYKVGEDEIFSIADYPLPEAIGQALSNPLPWQILDLRRETQRIQALFCGSWSSQQKIVNFQVFDSGRLLGKGWTLIGSTDLYTKLEQPGLVLQDKLTAHYVDGILYFNSYHNTKRFLDLSAYFREATDTDLDEFAANELFAFEDPAGFKQAADSIIRKKVALLQKNKVLQDLSVADIQSVAQAFNQGLATAQQINIHISPEGKLVVPKDKKQLKELIRFLDEDYLETPLSKRKCLTNSKHYL